MSESSVVTVGMPCLPACIYIVVLCIFITPFYSFIFKSKWKDIDSLFT